MEKKNLQDSKIIVPPNHRKISRSLLRRICEILTQETIKKFLKFFYSYEEHLICDIWSIVVEYLLHGFDYYVVVDEYNVCLTKTPYPVISPVLEKIDKSLYKAFALYNKNPGVDRFIDTLTVYLPTNASVKTVIITVENRYVICRNTNEIRIAISDWLFRLFYSTAINDLLM
jgi:hypothetical protein